MTATFEAHRAHLNRLAYRMLGSVADAEDMVQETYLRWHGAGEPPLDHPRAWFTRTCSRLCLDRLKSAQRNREQYVGEWLPEPLVGAVDGERARELDESLSMALMVTLERLRPAERASFLLHDVFDYDFTQVADILGKSPANCRQLAVRARRHLRAERPTRDDLASFERLSSAFFGALGTGDLAGLQAVLAEDVVLRSDGGGKAIAVHYPLHGVHRVARFLHRVYTGPTVTRPLRPHPVWFNGAPGVVFFKDDRPVTAAQLEVRDGLVAGVYILRNPDKLRGFRHERPCPRCEG